MEGRRGCGAHAGGGGGVWAGGWARAWGGGDAVSSAASLTVLLPGAEVRPGLAKVSRGARGARGAGGRGQRWGPHPARRGRIPPSTIHWGEPWWRRGECRTVPSRPNRTGMGPAGWILGGRARLGTGALGPGSLVVVGRRGGDRAGHWAAASEGGRGRARRGLPRAAVSWECGGGGSPLPGERRGPLLSEGGEWACIARCRAMFINGRAAWDYIPNPPRRSPSVGGS